VVLINTIPGVELKELLESLRLKILGGVLDPRF
jgi:hypothetical protein